LAENASFDVLIDDIRPSVFAVGDDKKKGKERKRKGREGRYKKVARIISLYIVSQNGWGLGFRAVGESESHARLL